MTFSASHAVIIGCGAYLPANVVSNAKLAEAVDTNDEWISTRTGIHQRHIAKEDEFTSDMAAKAAEQAIIDAGIKAEDIDLIIVATTTPDQTFPSTATKVQALLGMTRGAAFDVQAVCAGFIYALAIADNFIKTGQVKTALVIGADIMSRIVDWKDRSTCVLFGDGAGAVILQSEEGSDRGILSTHLYSDGRYGDILYTDGGVTMTGTSGKVHMIGQEVFKHAVEKMSDGIVNALHANALELDDMDLLIPHQANTRILQSIAKKLHLPAEKLVNTVGEHANTSAASIPLALNSALKNNRIQKGSVVAMTAIGGGLCWGVAVVRW